MSFSLLSRVGIAAVLYGSLSGMTAFAVPPAEPGDMPPLLPVVTCAEDLCEVSFSGVVEGHTVTGDPLPMQFSIKENGYWQPRFLSDEALKIDAEDAPFGWLIGEGRDQMELYLTPLLEPGERLEDVGPAYSPHLFMVEQRAGFEHVGIAYRFYAVSYDGSDLITAREIGPNSGPQPVVIAASTQGVTVRQEAYNRETGEFDAPAFEIYEWYSASGSMMLGSEAEMEEVYALGDIMTNEPSD